MAENVLDSDVQKILEQVVGMVEHATNLYEKTLFDQSNDQCTTIISLLEPLSARNDLGNPKEKGSQAYQVFAGLAYAYNRLNTNANKQGNYGQSVDYAKQAIYWSEQIGDDLRKAGLIANIGMMYLYLKDYEKAIEYLVQGLAVAERMNFKPYMAIMLSNLGMGHYYLKQFDQGLIYLHKAMALFTELNNEGGIAQVHAYLGILLLNQSDFETSLEHYQKALSMHQTLGNGGGEADAISQLGGFYCRKGNPLRDLAKAEEYILQAISLRNKLGMKGQVYESHKNLANVYQEQGRWQEAFVHLELSVTIEKEVLTEEALKKVELLDYERKTAEREKQVALLKERENILNNILPEEITTRLIKGENPIADYFDSVSILFMDIVDFTTLSTKISAQHLVYLLNSIFTAADGVMREFGLEKIKTIGDAYMAVAGAPTPQQDHVTRAAHAALALMDAMKKLIVEFPEALGERSWINSIPEIQVRIGLHCGPAAAGVVGENKFLYDLWGDAVNTASRMESHGEAGKIHCSEEFKNAVLVREVHESKTSESSLLLRFTERGEMEIKGKGMMRTFFLERA